MTKYNNYSVSDKAHDDVKAIKEDIQDIVSRVGNMKDDSLKVISEDFEQLMSKMYGFKDKVAGKDSVKALDCYIRENPVKSALYCLGAGIIISKLFRK